MRTPLVAGNWKMHKTLSEGVALVKGVRAGLGRASGVAPVEVLICPPFTLLFPLVDAVAGSRIMLGAQNAHEEPDGAFTGEVSALMLKDTGCSHVIVGHSERRHHFHEDGPRLKKKVRAVQKAGLQCIYCVGETLDQREAGRTDAVIEQQLADVLHGDLDPARLIVAYEPVWAIGTGRTATPEQAQEVHALIRQRLVGIFNEAAGAEIRILYGGSVKSGNAPGLMEQPDIDGALVGGASLVAEEFTGIISAAAAVVR